MVYALELAESIVVPSGVLFPLTGCPMCTDESRPRYNRDKLRYPSDLSDEEWAHIEPLISPGKPGGGKQRVDIRKVVNGVMHLLSTGCHWRAVPAKSCRPSPDARHRASGNGPICQRMI